MLHDPITKEGEEDDGTFDGGQMAAASESVNNAIDTIKKISLAENKKNNYKVENLMEFPGH